MNTQVAETSIAETAPAAKESLEDLLRENPQLNNPATLKGISALVEKLAPLLQGKRFHNVVDLLSAMSDVVDMTDDAMVQKMMKGYEDLAAGAFNLNNTVRFASAQAGAEGEPPTLWQAMKRFNRDEDARRGLAMVLTMLNQLGSQSRQSAGVLPDS
ncbi:MAG: DUF1641 domain-containing protein [Thermomonas sp.]